jgi:mannose/cellobiose epimerase-like protein (N-acyl-D-glucosamine 2-epimerase family)
MLYLARIIPVLLALCFSLFAASLETAQHIDHEWFRKTLAEETARWRKAAFRTNGFFAVSLDRQWQPVGSQNGTLVSQGRQIFVMTAGYELTKDPAYLEAARKGADFLLKYFRDAEMGLFFYGVDPEGGTVNSSKDCYGLAFALFGLSHVARVSGDERYTAAALETWDQIKQHLRDDNGLFRPQMDRAFTKVSGRNCQNPMMHLFESLLALYDATGSKAVLQEAIAYADTLFIKLYDEREGRLPEYYDQDWKPVTFETKSYLEIGHQFEWAYLLSRAVERGFPKKYLAIGERLLNYGVKVGYDEQLGGIFSRCDQEGNIIRKSKGWWEQCEALRAMMHYAVLHGRKDLWPAFDKSLEYAKAHLIDPEYGGWYQIYDPAAATERTGKGSVWQTGYHVSGLYVEALQLSK